jgi:hypothetical protein
MSPTTIAVHSADSLMPSAKITRRLTEKLTLVATPHSAAGISLRLPTARYAKGCRPSRHRVAQLSTGVTGLLSIGLDTRRRPMPGASAAGDRPI